MRQFRLGIVMFVVSFGMIWAGQAYAGGYTSLGGAFYVNTYGNAMDFDAPQSDVKFHVVDYLSEILLYDNLAVCQNNGGNFTYKPGNGQTDPGALTRPKPLLTTQVTTGDCKKTGSVNDCQESVLYLSKLQDVVERFRDNIPNHLCSPTVPAPYSDDAYGCYLYLLGLPADFQCQNSNGILIEFVTKGVCARQTARKDGSPQASQSYQYTYPVFSPQPENASFSSTMSATCGACLDGTGPCPNPTP